MSGQQARRVLFLQGLPSPFFRRLAEALTEAGCSALAVNLCPGDRLFWRGHPTLRYRGTLAAWPAYIGAVMDREHVTDLVLLGESRTYHREAIAAARARAIRVVTTDFGYLRPDWITFERDGMSSASLFPRDPDAIRALAARSPEVDLTPRYREAFWTLARWDLMYQAANLLLAWRYPHYRRPFKAHPPWRHYPSIALRLLRAPWRERHARAVMQELIGTRARYFVFPLQLEFDAQITAYSPFERLDDAIEQVVASFARHAGATDLLLIKVHPLDPGVRHWDRIAHRVARSLGVGPRLRYVDGGSLDHMIEGAAGMVTVNSTSGLRALQLGCPVKVLGDAIYDVPGLTAQTALDEFWTDPTSPDPALREAFVRALAGTVQIRGSFYTEPGLSAAVGEAAYRLCHDLSNQPLS